MIAAVLALLVTATPITEVARTPHFGISASARAEAGAALVASRLENLHEGLERSLGVPLPGVTQVRVAFDRPEFDSLTLDGERPPPWVRALAWPSSQLMLVQLDVLATTDAEPILRHEMVHLALGRYGDDWPRWFHEGLAQSLGRSGATGEAADQLLQRAARQGRLFSIEALGAGFPDLPADVELAYAESAAFVEHLIHVHGPGAVALLLERVKEGRPFEEAFAISFHTSLRMASDQFLASIPTRSPLWPLFVGEGAVWAGLCVLLCVAYVRRRRQLKVWHQAQVAVEAEEDARAEAERAELARLEAEAAAVAASVLAEPSRP